MTIHISIDYRTRWGESIVFVSEEKVVPMTCDGASTWTVTLEKRLQPGQDRELEYRFEVLVAGKTVRKEWASHRILLDSSRKTVTVNDRWLASPADAPFYSGVFKDVVFRRPQRNAQPARSGNVILKFLCASVRPGQSIAVIGSSKMFASWKRPVIMDDSNFPEWSVTLDVTEPLEYKFVIVDSKTFMPVVWESGENHSIVPPADGEATIETSLEPKFATRPWRGAGVAIPVFSLRSEDSFGVGEFHDLKKLVDWAASTGQSIVQILPINDTTMVGSWKDSYPYNANSTFALHPMYIHLPAAGVHPDKEYLQLKAELESADPELGRYVLDYERVTREKTKLLKKFFKANSSRILVSEDYTKFVKANKSWLLPYATFCVLRDEYGTPDFNKWGSMAKYNHIKASAYAREHQSDIDFHCYEQFTLDMQLKDAVNYAHSKGVALKGDLPIGISRTSVDAWIYPGLFHMDSQAGAPPDAFSDEGQNWGFPTYNWEEMSKDGYGWWKARFRKMNEYFDAFRIDHILGFFRIWEIPSKYSIGLYGHFNPALPYPAQELADKGFDPSDEQLFLEDPVKAGHYHPRIDGNRDRNLSSLDQSHKSAYRAMYEDFFYHRHNQFWKDSAMAKLPELLQTTDMLVCGEDLGMIPACVPDVMNDLRILSLEIQRMPKGLYKAFDEPWQYPYYSVCATGSHDTSNIRAWWEEDSIMTQRYYNEILGCTGPAPEKCEPWICEMILRQHAESPSMLCILPLQDWLSMDVDVRYPGDPSEERINVPANPRHYWRYRMHMTLEQLLGSDSFNSRLRDMILKSGRNI